MAELNELKKENGVVSNIEEDKLSAAKMANVSVEPDDIIDDDDDIGLIIDKDEITEEEEKTASQVENVPAEYEGPGVVLDKGAAPKKERSKSGLSKERDDEVQQAIVGMNNEIDRQRKIAEKQIAGGKRLDKEINDPNAPELVRDSNRALRDEEAAKAAAENEEKDNDIKAGDSVEIIIDKAGIGNFEFTDDEKKRIEVSKRIKLVEVEDRALRTIKVKKNLGKKKDFSIIKRNFDKSYSKVVALASGYTCKMKNLSAAEAIRMFQRPGSETANSMLEKWSVIYDKIIDVSCGDFKDFEDFCKNTAFIDYDAFIYGIICSSYPDSDHVQFTCVKDRGGCGQNFNVDYSNKQMIRTSLISDETKQRISEIVTASAFVDKSKKLADASPVKNLNRIELDSHSGILIDTYIPSVHEVVERIFRGVESNNDLSNATRRDLVVFAQSIKNIYIPDYDEFNEDDPNADLSYYEVSDLSDIFSVLEQLSSQQIQILANRIQKLTSPYIMSFGFDEVTCPHCKHEWGQYSMNLDEILFQRVQQGVTTEIV